METDTAPTTPTNLCDDPRVDQAMLAEVYSWNVGTDEPYFMCLFWGKAYRMVPEDDE